MNVHIFMCVHVLAAKQGRWVCVNVMSVRERSIHCMVTYPVTLFVLKVRPKMGKLTIDYQKLHDAFFK